MTRLDIQASVQQFFQDTVYYQTQDINNSIQDGMDEICAFTGCNWQSTTLAFQPNLTYYDFYTLIPGYVGVWAIFNHVIKRWLIPTSLRKLQQTRVDWDIACGTPSYFAPINFRYVAIFRKPLDPLYGNMEVFYLSQSPTLGDTTCLPIPDDSNTTIETYCEMDLLEQNQEWDQAQTLMTDYQEQLNHLYDLCSSKRFLGRTAQLR